MAIRAGGKNYGNSGQGTGNREQGGDTRLGSLGRERSILFAFFAANFSVPLARYVRSHFDFEKPL